MAQISKKRKKGPVSLADIVNEWMQTYRPKIWHHIEATGVQNGFFLDMKCGRQKPDDFVSIAYVGRTEDGVWLHGLSPFDKDFFKKFEKFIKRMHNQIHKDFGCNTRI